MTGAQTRKEPASREASGLLSRHPAINPGGPSRGLECCGGAATAPKSLPYMVAVVGRSPQRRAPCQGSSVCRVRRRFRLFKALAARARMLRRRRWNVSRLQARDAANPYALKASPDLSLRAAGHWNQHIKNL